MKGNIESYYVDDKYYSLTSDEYYTVDIGRKNVGDVVIKVNMKEKDNYVTLCAYSLNEEVFEEFYKELDKGKLNVTSYNETTINGDINVPHDSMIFTSIAYDAGWKVYVDNKPVKIKKIYNSYLGFNISKGKHKIKFSYYPDGLKLGLIVTVSSVIIMFIYVVFVDNNKKNKKKIK